MNQQLRLSQFVITYGPGAILEGKNGPRIIPTPNIGLFRPGQTLTPEQFEISDQRMREGLLKGSRIFRLPSNAEIGVPEYDWLYATRAFPSWNLCLNKTAHDSRTAILFQGKACPGCKETYGRREAIRFLRACTEGHLDDVYWPQVIHRDAGCSHRDYFFWSGGGGTLGQVILRCPKCGDHVSLGDVYSRSWPCSGRYPEREPLGSAPLRGTCNQQARIVQRQASNLRLPELKTLFTIPPRATRLHILLQYSAIKNVVTALGLSMITSKEMFIGLLGNLVTGKQLQDFVVQEVSGFGWPEIQEALNQVNESVPTTFDGLLADEFKQLKKASLEGYPAKYGGNSKPLFEVNPGAVRTVNNGKLSFRITPISRLQTVTVQLGYRRSIGGGEQVPDLVDVSFRDSQGQNWYPGVQVMGEGLFISIENLDEWNRQLEGSAVEQWSSLKASEYPDQLFRSPAKLELHPAFVWFHTLSHLLIRSLSVDAGYSAASIRERIYLDTSTKVVDGGIVLYATQPGSEGSLGGLIALVPHFESILQRAFQNSRSCSNDPLCSDTTVAERQFNGAACYGCTLLSETSCEHRNLWLDRGLL